MAPLLPVNSPLPDDHPLRRGAVIMFVRRPKPKPEPDPEVELDQDDEQNPLEAAVRRLDEADRASGHVVTDLPPEPEGTLTVNFIPRRRPRPEPEEDRDGRTARSE